MMHWSMALTAADSGAAAGEEFYALLAPENVWSSDGRMFAPDSLEVRVGPNELPLMGLIENTEMHDRAINVGHFTRMTRRADGWWEGWGVWAVGPEVDTMRQRVNAGDVTGVSVDTAVSEFEWLTPADEYDRMAAEMDALLSGEDVEQPEPERVKVDGVEYVRFESPDERMRALKAELMGATIVPFPAFGGATITDLAAPEPVQSPVAVTAAVAPVAPPAEWFRLPGGHGDAYDVVLDDDGRIHGYPAATWSSCHISFPDECITPPRSESDYAYFKVGAVRCNDGSRVKTGPLTLRGGHADRTWSASKAMAFYDDTDSAFADVNIGEDEHGIWIAGALRPEVTANEVRRAMGSGFSGDWRSIGGRHELIALSAVNTPGFRHHASLYEHEGLVASMILDMPSGQSSSFVADADALAASAALRIAASIGRTPEQRITALQGRVHAMSGTKEAS